MCRLLRFFCDFCRGDAGDFLIVEPAASHETVALGLSNSEQQLIQTIAKPVLFHDHPIAERLDPAKTHLSATIWYSNSLFFADFELSPDGMIEMLCDTLLFEGLSAVPDRPLYVDIKDD